MGVPYCSTPQGRLEHHCGPATRASRLSVRSQVDLAYGYLLKNILELVSYTPILLSEIFTVNPVDPTTKFRIPFDNNELPIVVRFLHIMVAGRFEKLLRPGFSR